MFLPCHLVRLKAVAHRKGFLEGGSQTGGVGEVLTRPLRRVQPFRHVPYKGQGFLHISGGANYLPRFLPISFSGVYLVLWVFRDIWPSKKENPSVYWHATLSCPFMASNYANFVSRSDLVLISLWMLTMPWIFYPISLFRRASRFIAF